MSVGAAVVCMDGYDYTVKQLQSWSFGEGEILDSCENNSLPGWAEHNNVTAAMLKSQKAEMKLNDLE